MRKSLVTSVLSSVVLSSSLVGCVSIDDEAEMAAIESAVTATYSVGGTIEGLPAGAFVVLRSGKDIIPFVENGAFKLRTKLAPGTRYNVWVPSSTVPCKVSQGEGVMGTEDVTRVKVTCNAAAPVFSIGGTVTGLEGQLVLRNGTNDVVIDSDGTFKFSELQPYEATYSLTVQSQPAHQNCFVLDGMGIVFDNVSTTVECYDVQSFYVSATTGNDANDGSEAAPLRTISRAIATAPWTGAKIYVAPGTYSDGETFPIVPRAHQQLIGDVANRGEGPVPTRISGSGTFNCSGGDLANLGANVTVGLEKDSANASIEGFSITGGEESVWACNVAAKLANNTVFGSTDIAVVIGFLANITLTNNTIRDGAYGLLVHDADTRVTARGNTFANSATHAVVLGYTSPFTGAAIDFGTAASPGNNEILGGTSGTGLYFQHATGSIVNAVGNTWRPNTQDADANGRYESRQISVDVSLAGGTNFSTKLSTGGGLKL